MTHPKKLCQSKRRQRGALYMMVLGMLVVMSIAAVRLVESRAIVERQAKEVELLFIGDQYRRAIESYASTTPVDVYSYLPCRQNMNWFDECR